jgi:type VII secretion integral membrane protein EccD
VVPAPTSGLARLTIRAPRRRLDLAVPDQVPLAEILPEVVRRAGEVGEFGDASPSAAAAGIANAVSGWDLRRADGAALASATALANQGVRDGDVLYLVPRSVRWPEPEYDDVVEEIAAGARRHGRPWDAGVTRTFALGTAGFVLLGGLAALAAVGPRWTVPALAAAAVALVLIITGGLLSRALGDGVAGAAAGGLALPYAAASGALGLAGDAPLRGLGAEHLLVGAAAALLASVVAGVVVGDGLWIFAAGVTAGLIGGVGAVLGIAVSGAGAAAILIVALVAGIGVAPLVAVRLGRLPIPIVSASPDVIASDHRPRRDDVLAAVVRADQILYGSLLGIALLEVTCAAMLARTTGLAGPLLGGLASATLLLRARLFPTVAARMPLLVGGLLGLTLVGWAVLDGAGPGTRALAVMLALGTVAILLGTAAVAYRRRGTSPYLGRLADLVDVVAVVALAPVACAVLDVYSWVRGLAG